MGADRIERMGLRFIGLVLFSSLAIYGQTAAQEKPQPRMIEVRGSAETLVTPNEFTFKISLAERYEKKEKITIEEQEKRLREELTKIGVDVQKDLTVFDLSSSFARRRRQKDELARKDYRLKLTDLEKVGKLQDLADDLNVSGLELVESTNSNLAALRKQTKIEAAKAAKAKAEYMLAAMGDKIGKTLLVEELPEAEETFPLTRQARNSVMYEVMADKVGVAANSQPALEFTQIKLQYAVRARFEIE